MVLELAQKNSRWVGTLLDLPDGASLAALMRKIVFEVSSREACMGAARLLGYQTPDNLPETLTKRIYLEPIRVVDRYANL